MPADHGTPNTGDEQNLGAHLPFGGDGQDYPARSPQGEGHEAFMAQVQRTVENAERRMYEAMRERDEARAYLSRVSPSRDGTVAQIVDYLAAHGEPTAAAMVAALFASPARDGTVAVEDVEKLAEALRNIADGRWNVGAAKHLSVREFARETLAEFGVSDRTERIHDQATKEEG